MLWWTFPTKPGTQVNGPREGERTLASTPVRGGENSEIRAIERASNGMSFMSKKPRADMRRESAGCLRSRYSRHPCGDAVVSNRADERFVAFWSGLSDRYNRRGPKRRHQQERCSTDSDVFHPSATDALAAERLSFEQVAGGRGKRNFDQLSRESLDNGRRNHRPRRQWSTVAPGTGATTGRKIDVCVC
jgi:hypothetical protein